MIEKKHLIKEETNLYFQYLKEGKKEYRDKLIIGNYGLVIHIALKYVNSEFELEDLVSIGKIGLIKAVDHFDYTKSITFATYASRCINNEILMAFRHKKNWINFNDLYSSLKENNGISLEEKLCDELNLEDQIVTKIFLQENMKKLTKIINNLDCKKRELLLDYFGLGRPSLNQTQLAEKYQFSQSHISKMLLKTLKEIYELMTFDEQTKYLKKILTKKEKKNKINL